MTGPGEARRAELARLRASGSVPPALMAVAVLWQAAGSGSLEAVAAARPALSAGELLEATEGWRGKVWPAWREVSDKERAQAESGEVGPRAAALLGGSCGYTTGPLEEAELGAAGLRVVRGVATPTTVCRAFAALSYLASQRGEEAAQAAWYDVVVPSLLGCDAGSAVAQLGAAAAVARLSGPLVAASAPLLWHPALGPVRPGVARGAKLSLWLLGRSPGGWLAASCRDGSLCTLAAVDEGVSYTVESTPEPAGLISVPVEPAAPFSGPDWSDVVGGVTSADLCPLIVTMSRSRIVVPCLASVAMDVSLTAAALRCFGVGGGLCGPVFAGDAAWVVAQLPAGVAAPLVGVEAATPSSLARAVLACVMASGKLPAVSWLWVADDGAVSVGPPLPGGVSVDVAAGRLPFEEAAASVMAAAPEASSALRLLGSPDRAEQIDLQARWCEAAGADAFVRGHVGS